MTSEQAHYLVDWNTGKDADYLIQWSGKSAYQYPLTAEQVETRLSMPGVFVFLMLHNGEPVGSIELDRLEDDPKAACLCRIILSDQLKGNGFGKQMVYKAIQTAFDEMKLERLILRVYCFNVSAIRCYEACGFRVKEYHTDQNPRWNGYTMELIKS